MTASENRNSLAIRPVRSIRKPAKMKNGIAMSVYLLRKLKKERNTVPADIIGSSRMKMKDEPASTMPIGTARSSSTVSMLASRAMSASPQSLLRGPPRRPSSVNGLSRQDRLGCARRSGGDMRGRCLRRLEFQLVVIRLPGEDVPAEQSHHVTIELEQRRDPHHGHADDESVLERPHG